MPRSAGMTLQGVVLAQLFMIITCFGCALHMKSTCSSGRQRVFGGMVSVLEHAGHFRLFYKGRIGFVIAAGV